MKTQSVDRSIHYEAQDRHPRMNASHRYGFNITGSHKKPPFFITMRRSGRRLSALEFGTCASPTGQWVRQVYPMNHSSQFWVTESGIPFEKQLTDGVFQWVTRVHTTLPRRMSAIRAVALAWTEPPEDDWSFPLRPIRLSYTEPLSPSAIAWTKCGSPQATTIATDDPDATIPGAPCVQVDMDSIGNIQWRPLTSLPSYVRADGHIEYTNLSFGKYEISPAGVLRVRGAACHAPLCTHLPGRPLRVALPEGSAFIRDICTTRDPSRTGRRTVQNDRVYACVTEEGFVDCNRIRQVIGSRGDEQTIHSAVFHCVKVRAIGDIDPIFIESTTSRRVRTVCLDIMRNDPQASTTAILSQIDTDRTWQIVAEVRMVRELILKYEFDMPACW